MGKPHEDLPVLEEIKRRLDEDLEQAKTLGNGGEGGSIYVALDSVRNIVEAEVENVRSIIGAQGSR